MSDQKDILPVIMLWAVACQQHC